MGSGDALEKWVCEDFVFDAGVETSQCTR
jgi:hypothetical protein